MLTPAFSAIVLVLTFLKLLKDTPVVASKMAAFVSCACFDFGCIFFIELSFIKRAYDYPDVKCELGADTLCELLLI